MPKIKIAAIKVCTELEDVLRLVPDCIKTIGIIKSNLIMIDFSCPILFPSKIDLLDEAYKSLGSLLDGASQNIKYVKSKSSLPFTVLPLTHCDFMPNRMQFSRRGSWPH